MQTFWNALSGVVSAEQAIRIGASNVANVSTPGYAKVDVSFADLLTNHLSATATAGSPPPRLTPAGWWGGDGSAAVQAELSFRNMGMQETGNATDLAMTGPAFFTVRGQTGAVEFTKAGNFHWSPLGNSWMLVTAEGRPVLDVKGNPVTVQQPSQVTFGADGSVRVSGQAVTRLGLATVTLPGQFLLPMTGTSYQLSATGRYQVLANPSAAGVSIQTGYLTTSNVGLSQEMANMVQSQNLYEANARAVQLADQMMSDANKTHA